MKLNFSFEGIETRMGAYPRAKILVTEDEDTAPTGRCLVRLTLTLPIAHLDAPTSEHAAQAIQAAHRIVNTGELQAWLQAQFGSTP